MDQQPTDQNLVNEPTQEAQGFNHDVTKKHVHGFERPEKQKREGLRSVLSTIGILLLAPLIAFFITAFVFQSYEVDGSSMETTLHNHDRLIVLKAGKTWARLTGKTYVPDRGDIVIFGQENGIVGTSQRTRQLIKRVIGLPGDRVVISDGDITIFNKDHPQGYSPDKDGSWASVIKKAPSQNMDKTLAEDEVFVCGDNRLNSYDSRSFGPIKTAQIIGTLSYRIYPFGSAKSF